MGRFFTIRLKDLLFTASIGVFDQERSVGNQFNVNVEIKTGASEFVTEDLSTSISYADVYDLVSEVMAKEWLLLESAAQNIAEAIDNKYPGIIAARVRLEKLAVPIIGMQGTAEVEYTIGK